MKDRYHHPHLIQEEDSARLGVLSKAAHITHKRQSQVEVQVCLIAKLLPCLPSPNTKETHLGTSVGAVMTPLHISTLMHSSAYLAKASLCEESRSEHMRGIAPKAQFSHLGATPGVNQTNWDWLRGWRQPRVLGFQKASVLAVLSLTYPVPGPHGDTPEVLSLVFSSRVLPHAPCVEFL